MFREAFFVSQERKGAPLMIGRTGPDQSYWEDNEEEVETHRVTPVLAGNWPVSNVAREGEQRHALVQCRWKVRPCFCSLVMAGRWSVTKESGQCWGARSWSVRMTRTFGRFPSRNKSETGIVLVW